MNIIYTEGQNDSETYFFDTSALIALGNIRDMFHIEAKRIFKRLAVSDRKLITTNAVIFELANAFSHSTLKPFAIQILDLIKNSKNWNVITIDETIMTRGIEKFKQMDDKDWSLVDCISMVIAEDQNVKDIFSSDHHFEQAGFAKLLHKQG